jgi:hypothetical protein
MSRLAPEPPGPAPMGWPARPGPRPTTCPELPHTQLDQQPDTRVRAQLIRRVATIPGVEARLTDAPAPGALALCVTSVPARSTGGSQAAGEFGHLHAHPDCSLHLCLPAALAAQVIAGGWGEPHHEPGTEAAEGSTVLMIYAPRTEEELEVIVDLLVRAHQFATVGPSRR